MTPELRQHVEQCLSAKLISFHAVGGGCINESFRLHTSAGDFFFKWNDRDRYPRMFAAEAKGLSLLQEFFPHVPSVIVQQDYKNQSFLILEWIEGGKRVKNFWQEFGSNLARMHSNSAASFGLDHNNYIGSLRQSNRQHSSWSEF